MSKEIRRGTSVFCITFIPYLAFIAFIISWNNLHKTGPTEHEAFHHLITIYRSTSYLLCLWSRGNVPLCLLITKPVYNSYLDNLGCIGIIY